MYMCVWMILFMDRSITMTDTGPWNTFETHSATAADDAAHPILEQEAAVGITTSYCATLAMGAMTGSPQLHGT